MTLGESLNPSEPWIPGRRVVGNARLKRLKREDSPLSERACPEGGCFYTAACGPVPQSAGVSRAPLRADSVPGDQVVEESAGVPELLCMTASWGHSRKRSVPDAQCCLREKSSVGGGGESGCLRFQTGQSGTHPLRRGHLSKALRISGGSQAAMRGREASRETALRQLNPGVFRGQKARPVSLGWSGEGRGGEEDGDIIGPTARP